MTVKVFSETSGPLGSFSSSSLGYSLVKTEKKGLRFHTEVLGIGSYDECYQYMLAYRKKYGIERGVQLKITKSIL